MKEKIHIVNLSGGKDSTAMLLGMIERNMPIDEILFFDWGKEFQGMYDHLEQLQSYVYQKIRKEVRFLSPDKSFEYWLFEHEKKNSQYHHLGYGWPRSWMRWCTRQKVSYFNRIVSQYKKEGFHVIEYIGFAFDEYDRTQQPFAQKKQVSFPLVDWWMTERAALIFCFERGFTWSGLYDIFKRVSCFCCPLAPLSALFKLYKYFPEHWEQLKMWDKQIYNTFKQDYSLEDLERRFSGMIKQEMLVFGSRTNACT